MDFNEVKERHQQEMARLQRARCPSGQPRRVPCNLVLHQHQKHVLPLLKSLWWILYIYLKATLK